MSITKKQFKLTVLLVSLLVAGSIVLVGCKKKTEPAAPESGEEVVSAVIEQTVCPVMGLAIKKSIFTEYKGKKVYFCCGGCKPKFEAEPEKYAAKLSSPEPVKNPDGHQGHNH